MDDEQALIPPPAAQLVIDDLEALKALTDPLRLRLVEILRQAPATVKEIAAILEVPPKSLYYHINMLEQHKLIRIVETRLVSGILEKRYQATAYLFIFSDLVPRGAIGTGEQGLQVMASSLFAITDAEIRDSIQRGLLDPECPDMPSARGLRMCWRLLRLQPAEAVALGDRLQALIAEYATVEQTPPADDSQAYRFVFNLFPVHHLGKRQGS